MEVPRLPVCRVVSIAFVGYIPFGEVDPNDADGYRMVGLLVELSGLSAEIADDAVYLLDHRLGEDLHFGANLDVRSWPASDDEAGDRNGRGAWD
jgi:hypothetical protein